MVLIQISSLEWTLNHWLDYQNIGELILVHTSESCILEFEYSTRGNSCNIVYIKSFSICVYVCEV